MLKKIKQMYFYLKTCTAQFIISRNHVLYVYLRHMVIEKVSVWHEEDFKAKGPVPSRGGIGIIMLYYLIILNEFSLILSDAGQRDKPQPPVRSQGGMAE